MILDESIFLRVNFLVCALDCKYFELENFKMSVPRYVRFLDYMISQTLWLR